MVVGSNKAGSIQAACSIDVQPLDDLRSTLKCVGDFTTDVSLRAMRANRKAESEKQNDVYEEYSRRRSTTSEIIDQCNSDVSSMSDRLNALSSGISKQVNVNLRARQDANTPTQKVIKIDPKKEVRPAAPPVENKNERSKTAFTKSKAKSAFCGPSEPVDPKEFAAQLRRVSNLLLP